MNPLLSATRDGRVRQAVIVERVTVFWTAAEAAGALAAGWTAHSIALLGFGLDSVIEFAAAFAVYRGLLRELRFGEDTVGERKVVRFIGWTFLALAVYITIESVRDLINRSAPSPSPFGVTLSAVALLVMVTLGIAKRRIGTAIGSRALLADSGETFVCAYLSLTVLIGVALNIWRHWWWADPIAALIMVPIVLKEGIEAIEQE